MKRSQLRHRGQGPGASAAPGVPLREVALLAKTDQASSLQSDSRRNTAYKCITNLLFAHFRGKAAKQLRLPPFPSHPTPLRPAGFWLERRHGFAAESGGFGGCALGDVSCECDSQRHTFVSSDQGIFKPTHPPYICMRIRHAKLALSQCREKVWSAPKFFFFLFLFSFLFSFVLQML